MMRIKNKDSELEMWYSGQQRKIYVMYGETTASAADDDDDRLKEEKCVIQNKSNFKRTVRSITYYSRAKWMNVAQCSNQSSAVLLTLLLLLFSFFLLLLSVHSFFSCFCCFSFSLCCSLKPK